LRYSKSTWWIDSGATIHVANSLYEFHTRRTLRRGEKSIRIVNDVEAEVEAIGELQLELNNGFILHLYNVLYILSLSRNLISISCLDDDGYDYQFGNKQGFHMRRTLQRGERNIRVANDVEAKVEAIGELPLKLNNGFILHLHNVLCVLSLSRNLISVS
jgi:hypothetical protein